MRCLRPRPRRAFGQSSVFSTDIAQPPSVYCFLDTTLLRLAVVPLRSSTGETSFHQSMSSEREVILFTASQMLIQGCIRRPCTLVSVSNRCTPSHGGKQNSRQIFAPLSFPWGVVSRRNQRPLGKSCPHHKSGGSERPIGPLARSERKLLEREWKVGLKRTEIGTHLEGLATLREDLEDLLRMHRRSLTSLCLLGFLSSVDCCD